MQRISLLVCALVAVTSLLPESVVVCGEKTENPAKSVDALLYEKIQETLAAVNKVNGEVATKFSSNEVKVQQVLSKVTSIESKVDELVSSMTAALTPLIENCVKKDEYEAVTKEIGDRLQNLLTQGESTNHDMKLTSTKLTELVEQIDQLNGTVQEIKTNTRTVTEVTTTAAPKVMTPCEDSVFQGSEVVANVCESAVKFQKCHLVYLAYHCCRSCTDAGLLSENGSHRYFNYNRQISVDDTLQFLLPSVDGEGN